VIVVDASAALSALLNAGAARLALARDRVHVPHLVDSEVANGLRRRVAAGDVRAETASATLRTWQRLGMVRYPVVGLLDRIWELRENVSPYDASYVALAESLGCALLTADTRLSRASGVRCAITVVPR
jgi:predicted nucleic acid-binding protein